MFGNVLQQKYGVVKTEVVVYFLLECLTVTIRVTQINKGLERLLAIINDITENPVQQVPYCLVKCCVHHVVFHVFDALCDIGFRLVFVNVFFDGRDDLIRVYRVESHEEEFIEVSVYPFKKGDLDK